MPVGAAASQPELETTGRCKTHEQPLALCASSTVCRCHSPGRSSEQGWGLLTSTLLSPPQAPLQGRVLGTVSEAKGCRGVGAVSPHAELLRGSHPEPRGLSAADLLRAEAVPALAPGGCEGPRGGCAGPAAPQAAVAEVASSSRAGCPAQAADILEGNSCSLLLPVVRSQRNGRPGARLCRLRPPRAVAGLSWGRTPEQSRA